ncbi:hypothetical protein SAMN04489732_105400 [Amycolatopsis saalfeldensis]|uniref:ABC-type transport system involved in multi-copper enzyme maturation, permease component n=1 Tax=Amycolatopsis saalfeldensis TaxID=394193 RepID=A0A1H8WPU0_9PSEU|nr:hypothetical protein SAMN04489732_105400 [Amycolatopsis saalfeldensis]
MLGIELRRSTALAAGALALVLGLVSVLYLLVGMEPAFGQWTTFTGLLRDALEFLCPVALGAGAWQGRREGRPEVAELITTTARPAWRRALPVAGALAITLTVAYLLVFAFGAVQVAGNTSYQDLGWLPLLLVGELALLAAVWLGLGIGTVLPSVYTTPILIVVSLALLRVLAFAVTGTTSLLGPGLHLRSQLLTFTPEVTLGQACWFTGLAVGGLVLVMATGRRRYLALLAIGVGLAVALPLFPATRNAAYAIDAGAAEPVCTTDAPRVCVTKAHAEALDDVTGPARDALRRLAPLASAPASVAESTLSPDDNGAKPQPSGVVTFDLYSADLNEKSQPTVSADQLETRMLEGAGTTWCTVLPPEEQRNREAMERLDREFSARELSASMLLGKPAVTFDAETAPLWPVLHALPAAEQQRRLSALRQALLSCQGDPLAILTQGR